MIVNAIINQYQPPGVSDGNGGTVPANAIPMSLAATLDAPTRAQTYTLGATIKDASAVLYVLMGKAVRPLPGGIYTVTLKAAGSPAQTYQVIHAVDRVHGAQSHYEAFLRNI
ncbi:MAG: hypothetical protein ACTHLZ_00150 [Tepidisphaeraceae bacterium]